MKIHAIQTGFVRIKEAQVEGRGHGLARRIAIFTDPVWTDWLPTYAWAIEHRDGASWSTPGRAHICSRPASPYIPTSDGRSPSESSATRKSGRSFGRSGSARAM